ncbi:class II glutamine amidotransferase [Thermococcus sp.]
MCRILFARGQGEKIQGLFEALVRSAENDPYRARRSGKRQHRDGWGYVLLRDDSVYHYRSTRPIFNDPERFRLIKQLEGNVVLMAHARAASQGSVNILNTQPFQFSSCNGFSFWFMHNGDLNKEELLRTENLNTRGLEGASDSYAFAVYLCRSLNKLDDNNTLKHYSRGAKLSRTTFNTGTLFVTQRKWKALVTAYMVEKYLKDKDHWNYARLIKLNDGEIFALASSTLELYFKARWENVANGEVYFIEQGRIKKVKLVMD